MILLPDSDGALSSSDWVAVGETNRWECLDDDNGATSYVQCDDNNEYMIIGFADPDDVTSANGGVAEADIDTIDSVRFLSSGRSTDRSFASRVSIEYGIPSGITAQTCAYAATRSAFTTVNGNAESHANGTSGGWSYANLESLSMKCLKVQTTEVYFSYLAIEVTYTEAVSADNATFFGTNF